MNMINTNFYSRTHQDILHIIKTQVTQRIFTQKKVLKV